MLQPYYYTLLYELPEVFQLNPSHQSSILESAKRQPSTQIRHSRNSRERPERTDGGRSDSLYIISICKRIHSDEELIDINQPID